MLADALLSQQRLQTVSQPIGRARRQSIEQFLMERSFLGDILQKLLIVDLPAELARNTPTDAAAARSGLAAESNGQTGGKGCWRRSRGAVTLEAVARRLPRL